MKKAIITAVFAATATFGMTAFAGQYIYTWGTITELKDHGDDLYVFGLDLSPNPAGCSTPSHARLQTSLSPTKKKGLRNVLHAAFIAGRQVKVKLHSTACNNTYPAIYGVLVK